jgi:hypothetical protein
LFIDQRAQLAQQIGTKEGSVSADRANIFPKKTRSRKGICQRTVQENEE